MLRTAFEWGVLWPATSVARVLAPLLALGAVAAGYGVGLLVYFFTKRKAGNQAAAKFQLMPLVYAWLVGIYVFLIMAVAVGELPRAISRYVRG